MNYTMEKLFNEFKKPSQEEWIQLLTKELKGADFNSNLIKYDEIEGVKFPAFFHQTTAKENEYPGVFPYKRGFFSEINNWSIIGEIVVIDAKESNKKALNLLMSGNNALHFEFNSATIDLDTLFDKIEFQYIETFITTSDINLFEKIKTYFESKPIKQLFLNYNPLAKNEGLNHTDFIELKNGLTRNFEVDSYSIQQVGANCIQEVAFSLCLGHKYIKEQLDSGKTIDDALVNLHFTFGIGSNYLFEIAKFRAFRMLWATIARSYSPKHSCNETLQITAKTGFLNKSLKDPYTNLLRQTTEVMSAVLGGANHILNQAYDKLAQTTSIDFTERMATNISLLLKEESYLDKVLDSVGGSYALEFLTNELADSAWKLFQQTEKEGTISSLLEEIKITADKRIDIYKKGERTLIGINKYPNPEITNLEWNNELHPYFGIKPLILEKEIGKAL